MLSLLIFGLASVASFGSASPTIFPKDVAATKPEQIRGVQDPIFHLYLQSLPGSPSVPVMGPETSSEYFIIGDTIQSTNSSLYLNIGAASTSYLPLTLDATSNTTAWGLEGDTIITETGSTYGRQLNFLVCATTNTQYYQLYLQTGSDEPAGKTCSNYQTIHLPCLC